MTNHTPHFFDLWTSLQHQSQDLNEKQRNCWDSGNQLFPVGGHHQHQRRLFCFSGPTNISLDLCTESLGSETGTHAEDEINSLFHHDQQTPHDASSVPESYDAPVASALACRRSRSFGRHERSKEGLPSFPPPLFSSSHHVHVSSHRENGRLVLRAFTRRTRNYLEAQRIDGRLRLRLLRPMAFPENGYEDEEEEEQDEGEEQEENEQGCQEEDGPEGHELVLTHHQQSRRNSVVLKRQHQAAATYVVNHHHFVSPPPPRWWNDPVTSSSAFFVNNRSRHGIHFPPTTIRSTVAEAEDGEGEEQRRGAAYSRCSPEETESALGMTTLGGGRCTKESRQPPAFLLWEPPFYAVTTS
ncbi:protein FANTASTIC FOUR 3-like [Nymphaea colorata]|uniref:protein FANTASTIC FOUR 3-like n=1 Tax=Nymphaea colorata TaxID=210225 RepID=UPI00129EB6D1|nr:protein FANTASTIC FOUR 3-like [Nymphaea colorata]